MKERTVSKRYDREVFTVVTDLNYQRLIPEFCEALYRFDMSKDGAIDGKIARDYTLELQKLLFQLPRPYTILQENYYIDRSFRDSYYSYFSNQHFKVKRYSRRLSFFRGEMDVAAFFASSALQLEREFMGACVVNPLTTGILGRTLIDPDMILPEEVRPLYMRLSRFKLHVYGRELFVRAFPYRMQDEETMRCTEVTLLNLLEYYANSYPDYRNVTPSELLNGEQKHSHERVLPSRGTSYPILTKLMSRFGFHPRLYDLHSMETNGLSGISREAALRRCLHYYIESGIPAAVNLMQTGHHGAGHSVICIGHGCASPELIRQAKKNRWITWENRAEGHPVIDSADFYDSYVVVDDNQPVYQVRTFPWLSMYPDMRVENISVPLYKRMFLDAADAAAIIRTLLHDPHLGIDAWARDFLKPKEPVIIRLFMASSNSLKEFRTGKFEKLFLREAYALTPMPRFVWVCEIYRESDYQELRAFGEIVLDATAAPGRGPSSRSLILMHYPGRLALRTPEQGDAEFDSMIEFRDDGLFAGYQKNLTAIERTELEESEEQL